MSQIKRLQTIDADTLQSTAYEPVSFVVDDLLPQGLHLLAGAPKIGKSWLALWLCLCAAQGKPLWTFATRPCEVLLEKIDPAGAEGLTPNSFSHRIRKSVDALRRSGITVSFRKSNGDRLICLKRVDGVDDLAAGNIVTIDPENPPCFGV